MTTPPQPTLRECCFCGSKNIGLMWNDSEGWTMQVICRGCRAQGPRARGEIEARRLYERMEPPHEEREEQPPLKEKNK